MSLDLDRQLREYCQQMDEKQGVLSFDDILERSGEVQVIPGRRSRQPSPQRKWIVAVAAAVAVLLLVTGILLLPANDETPDPADQPTTPPITAPTTLAPNADSIPLPVRGWPDTNENSAGVYSWDGSRCAGSSCNVGFMHNGYGSGDVEIRFDVASEGPTTDDGTTAVTVAGHDGTHRRIDPSQEEWAVSIEGRTITITLIAEPWTIEADLTEAYAIIDSIRTEPIDNDLGFRLVFTLSTDDWDSG